MSPESDRLARLAEWLRAQGAALPKLRILRRGGERGVYATDPIFPGELILSVPRRCILTLAVIDQSPIGKQIADRGVSLAAEESYFAAFLLFERRDPDSFWKPFVEVLPESFPHNVLGFDRHALDLLAGSFLLDLIGDRHHSIDADEDRLRAALPGFAAVSSAEFEWARLAVVSRTFGLTIDGHECSAMVPMGDMLNHQLPPDASWDFSVASDAFEMMATTAIPAGAEIHGSYGSKCNSRYLLNYGFVLDENEDNECALYPRLTPAVAAFDRKRKLLGSASERGRRFQLSARPDDWIARKLFSFLRVVSASESELSALTAIPDFAKLEVAPISADNEARALALLMATCTEALERFPTTVKEDDALLSGGIPSGVERNCIVMRRGEKRVIEQLRAQAEEARARLPGEWEAVVRRWLACSRVIGHG